jgi:hypothetical protein
MSPAPAVAPIPMLSQAQQPAGYITAGLPGTAFRNSIDVRQAAIAAEGKARKAHRTNQILTSLLEATAPIPPIAVRENQTVSWIFTALSFQPLQPISGVLREPRQARR